MSRRTGSRRDLSEDDRILWNQVARTAIPLKGKALPEEMVNPEIDADASFHDVLSAADAAPLPQRPRKAQEHSHTPRTIDQPTRQKLAKGRLALEARVDLHGMTQGEAHALLLGFLHRAHAMGIRHVLVITGKGASLGSEGALRKAVPAWFATPSFRPLVGGYEFAARHHGGAGALYVRLRRQSELPSR